MNGFYESMFGLFHCCTDCDGIDPFDDQKSLPTSKRMRKVLYMWLSHDPMQYNLVSVSILCHVVLSCHSRIWDVECGACLRLLEGHEELVRCIRFDDKRIVSGAYDG